MLPAPQSRDDRGAPKGRGISPLFDERELKVLAYLGGPGDRFKSAAECGQGCSTGGSCPEVGAEWLCVVRCDRDQQCPAPKKCLCGDQACSVHLYDVFRISDVRVCVLDKLGINSPEVQQLLRANHEANRASWPARARCYRGTGERGSSS